MRDVNCEIRCLGIRTALVLGCLSLVVGCGGGGGSGSGGGPDDDEEVLNLLTSYEFSISNPEGAPGEMIRSNLSGGVATTVYEVDAGTGSIRGNYTLASGDMFIAETTTYAVDWTVGGPSPSSFTVAFNQQSALPRDNFLPADGSFTVAWAGNDIEVTYGASSTDVSLNGAAPVSFNPLDFSLLKVSTTAPDWQRVASMASGALVDVVRRGGSVAALLVAIFDGELDTGQSVIQCTGIPGTAPGGVGPVGEIVTVDMGADEYLSTATDCFSRVTGQPIGALLTGTVSYGNLVSTESNNLITRAGFEGSAQRSGGVSYDLRQRFVRETEPLVWNFENFEDRLEGGFSIVFTEP
jgi:hypothetical protein